MNIKKVSLRAIRRERKRAKIVEKVFRMIFDIAWDMRQKGASNE